MTQTQFYGLSAGVAILAVFVGGWIGAPKNRQGLGMMVGLLVSWLGVIVISLVRGTPETDEQKADARSRSSAGLVVGCLGVVAVVGLAFAGSQIKEPLAVTVGTIVGYPVSCEREGWMMVGGSRADLYGCTGTVAGAPAGCFVRVGDFVQDVTAEARSIGEAGGDKFPCVPSS